MENGMYVHAIQVYQNFLRKWIWKNMNRGLLQSMPQSGCVKPPFPDGKGLEYFSESEWESSGERQALKTCLLALHSVRTEEEYKAQARELGSRR